MIFKKEILFLYKIFFRIFSTKKTFGALKCPRERIHLNIQTFFCTKKSIYKNTALFFLFEEIPITDLCRVASIAF